MGLEEGLLQTGGMGSWKANECGLYLQEVYIYVRNVWRVLDLAGWWFQYGGAG